MLYLYQFCDNFSFLILSAVGLAIIFGMMGIINLAHGEFIMLGAYITTILAKAGLPLPLAIAAGTAGTGLYGIIIDRLIICRLYSRPLDSVVTTWGISLVMCQGMRILFGSTYPGVSTPLGSFTVGGAKYSVYRIVLTFVSVLLIAGIYFLFMHTKIGLKARATMQSSEIANSLGVNTNRMYAFTFMLGSALAGLTGGLYAPTMSITPDIGSNFMMESFVTVIVGGTNPLLGTVVSGGFLSFIRSAIAMAWGTFAGRIGLLAVAILFIRVIPQGFSGLIENIQRKREARVNVK